MLWNNVTLWRCINPSSCIVDYQHGIIFDGHIGYINDKSPPKIKSDNDIITFVYGEWFKNLLITSDNTKFYSKKNVINIGLNKYNEQKKISFNPFNRSNEPNLSNVIILGQFIKELRDYDEFLFYLKNKNFKFVMF